MNSLENQNIGQKFLQQTKYPPNISTLDSKKIPYEKSSIKEYPEAKKIILPQTYAHPSSTLVDCLENRRSYRNFEKEPLTIEILNYLLWASGGISKSTPTFNFRTVPSAGALYPIETYLIINNVNGISPGLYHWNLLNNELDILKQENLGKYLRSTSFDQAMLEKAPVVFIWTAVFGRSFNKYKERTYRYVFLDAGHIAAHLSLAAVSLNCSSCQVGAFFDDRVNEILGIDGISESVIYMSVVGKQKK